MSTVFYRTLGKENDKKFPSYKEFLNQIPTSEVLPINPKEIISEEPVVKK